MSVREKEREKSDGSGRGVGVAAAAAAVAVGVGVGAALYYFLNKRSENNTEAGVSSQHWQSEDTHVLRQDQEARRMQAFRERSWSLEECSICFDVILKDQEVMALPCTHQFHAACVLPWLEQRQTCPNCRKSVD